MQSIRIDLNNYTQKEPKDAGSFLNPKVTTPCDETGLPYSLWPNKDLPAVGDVLDRIHPVADFHHVAHPRSELNLNDKADLAVMNSRVEWTLYGDHHVQHSGYHAHYDGPKLPKTRVDKIRWVVMASAGHIGGIALDCSADQPVEREMPPALREKLWNEGIVRVACPAAVRGFLVDTLIDEGFEGIAEGAIMKFLQAKERSRKLELGHFLLSQMTEDKIAGTDKIYKEAYQNGTIPAFVPKSPQRFIRKQLTSSDGITNRLINKLEQSGSQYLKLVS